MTKNWQFVTLVLTALLLTGCSDTPELSENELKEYSIWQACIDKYLDNMAWAYSNNEDLFDDAVEACKELTPG